MNKAYILKFSTFNEFIVTDFNLSESSVLREKNVLERANILFLPPECMMHYKAVVIHKSKEYNIGDFLIEILLKQREAKPIIIISILSDALGKSEPNTINDIKDRIYHFKKKYLNSSFWFNSSCWIRYAEISPRELFIDQIDNIIYEFQVFSRHGIFTTTSSKEVFDFQARTYSSNYLNKNSTKKGHSGYIVPKIYHDEIAKRDSLLLDETNDSFKKCGLPRASFFHDIKLRILLIDDKTGIDDIGINGDGFNIENSKAHLISSFMKKDLFIPDHHGNKKTNLIWASSTIDVKYFSFDTVKKLKYGNYNFEPAIGINDNTVIIQVANIAEAIYLLSRKEMKFDLILIDYLLEERSHNLRELATSLFLSLNPEKSGVPSNNDVLKELEDKLKTNGLPSLKELSNDVKSNRGPLKKLWIFPVTAYNDTLISDLVDNNIRLIDYYWHISKGADPTTTPYLFLSQLNNFLYLQLENSVFDEDSVVKFLKRTIEKLKVQFPICFGGNGTAENDKSDNRKMYDFSALMASEYAVFVDRFMRRAEILRDKDKSLYADYIWTKFYRKAEYQHLFKLTQYIQKFYHRCAYGTQADYGKMVLFYKEMQAYIKHNTHDGEKLGLNRVKWSFSLSEFYSVLKYLNN